MGPKAASAALSRIRLSTELESAAPAKFVFEALPENLDLKVETFARLDVACDPQAVLATASGHPASSVTSNVRARERVVATHFWYPAQLLPLVEVCGAPNTDASVVTLVSDLLRAAGKRPVVIDREVNGFIGNRLLLALLREAWSLWADGIASASAIDAVVRGPSVAGSR